MVVSVSVLPPLKRTWILVVPSAGILMRVDVLDDVGEQSFAFAVRRIRIFPELIEVCRHGDQPLADRFIEDELILLSRALSFFSGFGQYTELLVPFAFERVGDEAITRIDQHEAALREIRFDLGAFDRAAA